MKILACAALAATASLALAGCVSTKLDTQIATADAKLRDKCAYAQHGVRIANFAANFLPGLGGMTAAALVNNVAAAVDTYCDRGPVTNIPAALAALERIIVSVRPIADDVRDAGAPLPK